MRSGGGEADDSVTWFDTRAIDDGALLNDANAETGQGVVVTRIHARHLGGLPANQRCARLAAALGDASDHRLGDVYAQLPGRVVVQKEQRLGPLNDDVVFAQ